MVGAEIAFLLLVQASNPQDAARNLDSAVRAIPGITANEAPVIGDEPFLRRLYRDLVDAAPSAAEERAFATDPDPRKRAAMIDRLLADERFADFWSKRFGRVYFGDLERPRLMEIPDKPFRTEVRAVGKFQVWLRDKLRKDAPWTEIVFQMLNARGTLEADPALGYLLSFQREEATPTEFAQGVARDFLGIRLYCSRCHDHPYDKWRYEDLYQLAAFAVRQKVGVVKGEVELTYAAEGEFKDSRGLLMPPEFLLGGKARADDDRMKVLAELMTQKSNAQLPRALANRVWSWLFGVGIVNPVDDFNMKNRPASPQLLPLLAKDLAENNYSLKRLVRVICATQAYQMALPEEAPEASSFRKVVGTARGNPRHAPIALKPAPLPVEADLPAAWTRVKVLDGSRGTLLVRGKTDPGLTAEVQFFEGKRDQQFVTRQAAQFLVPLKVSAPVEQGSAIVLSEISGPCSCVASNTDGPTPWVVWAAVVQSTAGPVTVKFEGHASVVRDWRAEFVQLLKSAK
jgi:hypothetical protein